MQGYELVKRVENEKREHPEKIFIKWWRNEQDFIDFDLVARFLERYQYSSEIAGFTLIDMEEMWQTVKRRAKGEVSRFMAEGQWMVQWTPPPGAEEVERLPRYPYTAEMLLKILDAETGGNYVD